MVYPPHSPSPASRGNGYPKGNATPTASTSATPSGSTSQTVSQPYYDYQSSASPTAGPSRWEDASSLGLSVTDEMDDATRALIEQIQREELENEEERLNRRRQELADEEMARKEQQNEREQWERSRTVDIEQRRNQQMQIERDEQQAVSPLLPAAR